MGIGKTVKEVIAEQLNKKAENIKEDSEFIKDLKADSLDLVEIIMSLEEKFNIQIPDKEAEQILSVAKAVDYIKKKKS